MATWQYSKRRANPVARHGAGRRRGFVGSFIGAWAVTLMSPDFLRKLLPLVMVAVLAYTPEGPGPAACAARRGRTERLIVGTIGLVIGLYDGFFGPGTGSFFRVRLCAPAGL